MKCKQEVMGRTHKAYFPAAQTSSYKNLGALKLDNINL